MLSHDGKGYTLNSASVSCLAEKTLIPFLTENMKEDE